jgi:hypothetical protein
MVEQGAAPDPAPKTSQDEPGQVVTMQIKIPSQLDRKTLKSVVVEWPSSNEVEIQLHHKQWVTPTGMVGLACLIDRHKRNGGKVSISAEGCKSIGYWERMGFFKEVGIDSPCSPVNAHPPQGRFSEVRKISSTDFVDEITDSLVQVAEVNLETRKTYSHILSEAMNNVCQHSGAFGFASAQYWKKRDIVEFCIADSGCGLFSTLCNNFHPNDAASAIDLAAYPIVSGNAHSRCLSQW